MSTKQFQETIDIPEGINITVDKHMLGFQGPLGKTFKSFRKIPIDVEVADGKVTLKALGKRKRDYSILHTARSLIRNICEGLTEGYTIKMKVVYAHFPITVKVDGKTILIENFQGERAPRKTFIVGNTKVIPKGEDVVLTGEVWTDVTQTAANIELKTKVKNKDHRVFLDGIYIYEKKKGIEK
ncbi:MAG: 50S ribosomal protein L6 [Nitrosopumilus sp.]|jgi:large subunit ribosomal protein L6|uniref:50S ribosomal protein L6 n=3 Tax=Candidatus Nitrosomaritimum aestuariumsis TaxID=3342354 RepID=A0AC60VZ43_9ARCH|nr:50S ribosomal protein L6 [Nitrosopumilaceae archaeon]MBA4461164.1 50S ribosomal protein L6 [Nitrosopumilaceae archaeon]MBA4464051.1 50S ribosomal protein L6 [Nitrosopumilaceae archaeon]NCF22746.1 50S ribosomal protein L6 [Nitrosopumilaceae archaeon]